MSQAFIGEIDLFAFDYAPMSWAFADGSLMPIRQNTQLFSLLGTAYGGNGTITFGLPNLSQRAPCGQGNGPGLSPRAMGDDFGAQTVTLAAGEMPAHNHAWTLQVGAKARSDTPAAGSWLAATRPQATIYLDLTSGQSPDAPFSPKSVMPAGGGLSHNNRQPYLAMTYGICLNGEFPHFG